MKTKLKTLKSAGRNELLKYPSFTPWGTWLMALVCIIFAYNVNIYWVGGIFALGILLSLFVGKRFVMGSWGQVLLVAGILLMFIALGQWGGLSPQLSVAVGLNRFTFYLGVAAMSVILVKCYKMKYRRELYSAYLISLGLYLVGGLYSPWKWDFVNISFFFLFAVCSMVYFLDLFIITQDIAQGVKPPRLGQTWILYLIIPLVAILCIFITVSLKKVESNMLELLLTRFQPATFYSFTARADLGRMENMLVSRRVTMKITTPRPISLVQGMAYNTYDRGLWRAEAVKTRLIPEDNPPPGFSPDDDRKLFPLTHEIPHDTSLQMEHFQVDIRRNDLVYRCRGSVAVELPPDEYNRDSLGNFRGPFGSLGEYRILFVPGGRGFPGDHGPGPQDLAVPPELKERFFALAGEIMEGRISDGARALAVEGYLQKNIAYNRGIRLTRQDMDPVEEFLFMGRSAHCEYFASAMVLLLRSRGIPARYVLGFMAHEYSAPGGYYVIRQKDAHAWVSAWIDGRGWVVFDPTPPGGRPDALDARGTDWLDFAGTRIKELFNLIRRGSLKDFFLTLGDTIKKLATAPPFIAGAVALLVLLIVFKILPALKKSSPGEKPGGLYDSINVTPPEQVLSELMARFDEAMEKVGLSRPFYLTPREFAGHLEEMALRHREDPGRPLPDTGKCRAFLEEFSFLRYCGDPITPVSLERLKMLLKDIQEDNVSGDSYSKER